MYVLLPFLISLPNEIRTLGKPFNDSSSFYHRYLMATSSTFLLLPENAREHGPIETKNDCDLFSYKKEQLVY
uniref:Ovule protein n=1 Tax=Strongyloides venezuelensis TaxID=75913 RepID=A0A0K0EWT9_STRVS